MTREQQRHGYTDQHEKARQQKVEQVPHQSRKPEVRQVDTADLLHMLGLDGGLCHKQQSEGTGQGSHAVHQVDGNGEACVSPTNGDGLQFSLQFLIQRCTHNSICPF